MNWKVIASSLKHRDMQKRVFAVLGILIVYRIMAHIPIPLSNPETLKQVLTNVFTGEGGGSQFLSFVN
ncbi:MAG TPA: hypothetical protein VFL85_01835, partial [Candidatus Saccharimonadales bacterium]|nr:hypothetical protein [Candidatus Saccharimonadales bacterium]